MSNELIATVVASLITATATLLGSHFLYKNNLAIAKENNIPDMFDAMSRMMEDNRQLTEKINDLQTQISGYQQQVASYEHKIGELNRKIDELMKK